MPAGHPLPASQVGWLWVLQFVLLGNVCPPAMHLPQDPDWGWATGLLPSCLHWLVDLFFSSVFHVWVHLHSFIVSVGPFKLSSIYLCIQACVETSVGWEVEPTCRAPRSPFPPVGLSVGLTGPLPQSLHQNLLPGLRSPFTQPLWQGHLLGKTLAAPVSLWGRLLGISEATAWW